MGKMNQVATLKAEIGLAANDGDVDEIRTALIKHLLTEIRRSDAVLELAALLGINEYSREQLASLVHVTKAQAVTLGVGQTLHHVTKRNRDGTPMRVRVSGRCKTWVKRPAEFILPVKYGMYESGTIDNTNAGEWYVV